KVVLNDIGPSLDDTGLSRIAEHVGRAEVFDSFEEAAEYVECVSQSVGPHDEAGWRALAGRICIPTGGRRVKHYDLAVAEPIARQDPAVLKGAEALLWPGFQSLSEAVLVLRGETSDLLSEQSLMEMQQRNTRARGLTFKGVGHAPTLRSDDQLEGVADFLLDRQRP